jgi:formylglycine-generating enzyme required for sulfatase activity
MYARRHRVPDMNLQAIERAKTPPGMVYVSGGTCLLGSDDADADDDVKPMRREFVASFYIDKMDVTNTEFRKFRPDHDYPPSEANLPATNITYDEAASYAKWAGKRLPTETEWEKAARGAEGRRYPWGNAWNADRVAKRAHGRRSVSNAAKVKKPGQCAIGTSRVQPVGSVPFGASPYGCLDMAGNAWQWVEGYYNGDQARRILRGGAVGYGERSMRTYNRAIEGSGDT